MPEGTEDRHRLKRSLSLPLTVLYGVGVTVGAGIYVLVGKVAGAAGLYAPLAFLLAALLAGFTACSYAELSSRFPKSAGEAVYVFEGFKRPWLSLAVGFGVLSTGTLSSAAIIAGYVGYLRLIVDLPDFAAVTLLTLVLAGIVIWGIRESVAVASLITLIELSGLLMVVWAGSGTLFELPAQGALSPLWGAGASSLVWPGIWAGALLAFYAFIGFEDLANVAEEVRDPARNLPRAIALTLLVTAVFYFSIVVIAIRTLSPETLGQSEAPLADVFMALTGSDAWLLGLIAVLAVLNGVLIQLIMGSRMLYGLADQKWLPGPFNYIWPRTQTPVIAIAAVAGAAWLLAVFFSVENLAASTSYVTLAVFALVNAALVRLKLVQSASAKPDGFTVPLWVPVTGAAASLGLLLINAAQAL